MQATLRSRPVLGAALLVAATGLVACGDDGGSPDAAATRAPGAMPFPPRAAEPPRTATSDDDPRPAGRVIRVGGRPEGIAVEPSSGLLGVATNGPTHSFALLDPSTLAVKRTVPLPSNARHVQSGAGRFLVPLEEADRLAVVDPAGGAPQILAAGDQPHDAAAVGEDLVVGDEFGGTATVLRGGKVRATVPVDVQPGGVVAVSDHVAAIISVRAYTVALLDLRTLELGPSQSAGYGPSHVVRGPDGRLFIADTRGGAMLEYATRPRLKALARIDGLGGPYGLAVDEERRRLWVTDVRGGRLLMVDVGEAGKPRVAQTWRAVDQPNSVAVDPRSGAAIVAGERGGLLQRVEP